MMDDDLEIWVGQDGVAMIYLRYGHQWYKYQELLCCPENVNVDEDGA